MTILKKYSISYIHKLNFLNKRYILIRDLLEKDKNMPDDCATFYILLIMSNLLYRDNVYSLLYCGMLLQHFWPGCYCPQGTTGHFFTSYTT